MNDQITKSSELSKAAAVDIRDNTCRNCGQKLSSEYCPHCGQDAATSRFTLRDMAHILFEALDFEHGVLRLAKDLTLHPARLIRSYIAGKRVRVFGPMRYLLMTAALLAVVYSLIEPDSIAKVTGDDDVTQSINFWASSWMSLLVILSIPFYSLATRLLFREWRYNYAENLVVNMFLVGHVNLVGAIIALAFNWTSRAMQVASLMFTLLYPVVVYTALCTRKKGWAAVKGIAASLFGLIVLLLMVLALILLDMLKLHGALGLVHV